MSSSGIKDLFKSAFLLLVVLLLLPTSSNLLAHHSDAALDMTTLTRITGQVSDYSLRNPHAYVTVTVNENGTRTEWDIQMASAITMRRLGWTRDSLAIGETVNVALYRARDGRPYGLLNAITRANGEPLVASPRGVSRLGADSADTASSIAGRWLVDRTRLPDDYPGGLDQLMIRELTLTEQGQVLEAAYSQASEENPELSCISKPTPAMIIYTDLYPLEIIINDDETITLRSQYFDQERIVYMDGREHPPAGELFHEGHSTGIWEDDILVIDTGNFTYHRSPYQNGIPSGPQKHIVERFQLLEGGTHMRVSFTLEDPEYIVGSMNYSRDLRYAPTADMSPFNCDLESTRRFLPD